MIIVGYQGIGKSTLAGRNTSCIDLESGNFWVDGKRDEKWYIPYCNIATHLSQQGFCVFVSSHQVVRDYLREHCTEPKYIICPAIELKDQWIQRLSDRFEQSGLDKDYKALMNAKDRYKENIKELLVDTSFVHRVIRTMDYDLQKMVDSIFTDIVMESVQKKKMDVKPLPFIDLNKTIGIIVDNFASDQLEKNINACAFTNRNDFANGARFGMSQAAMFIITNSDPIYVNVKEDEKEG